jgi:hypothetical protein
LPICLADSLVQMGGNDGLYRADWLGRGSFHIDQHHCCGGNASLMALV